MSSFNKHCSATNKWVKNYIILSCVVLKDSLDELRRELPAPCGEIGAFFDFNIQKGAIQGLVEWYVTS